MNSVVGVSSKTDIVIGVLDHMMSVLEHV
eukprot:COSAG06_NODE_58519_length_277_cov_0.207865_2_plen_28_part_01